MGPKRNGNMLRLFHSTALHDRELCIREGICVGTVWISLIFSFYLQMKVKGLILSSYPATNLITFLVLTATIFSLKIRFISIYMMIDF
jgi:hypothetical protein